MEYKHLTRDKRFTIEMLLQRPMILMVIAKGTDFSELTDEMLAEIE